MARDFPARRLHNSSRRMNAKKPNLLVIDDDPKFQATMRRGLEDSGMAAASAGSAEDAYALLVDEAHAFDLILLDVMLPGDSGWELLDKLRARSILTPVIFVTARHEVGERVKGLRLGADDYIVKPFELAELLARIDVVLRRGRQTSVLEVGDLRVDLLHRHVERSGIRVELSPRELDLLQILASSPGQTFGREALLQEVWGTGITTDSNVLNVLVARLRRRLEQHGPPLIETVIGEGYRLIPGDSPSKP